MSDNSSHPRRVRFTALPVARVPVVGVPVVGLPEPYRRRQFVSLLAVVGTTLLVSLAVNGEFGFGLLNAWIVLTIAGVGFYLVFGLSGQFAFSQAGFMSVGAYTSVWVTSRDGAFVVAVVAAVVASAVVAGVLAVVISRSEQFYFAIATLATSFLIAVVFREWESFSGAGGEVVGIPRPELFGTTFTTEAEMFRLFLGALAIALLVVVLVERSPLRRDAVAVRDSPVVAAFSGVPVKRRKILFFVLGSAFAGAAGALLAHRAGAIFPETFSLQLAINLFLALLFGGIGSMWGPVLGALFVVWAPEQLRFVGRYEELIYGGLLVVIIVAVPEGLVGIAQRVGRVVRRKSSLARAPVSPSEPPSVPTPTTDEQPLVEQPLVERPLVDDGTPTIRPAPLLVARDVTVTFGGLAAVSSVSLQVAAGEIVGLVGPNGSGKSTFVNAVTGLVPARGTVDVGGTPLTLGRPAAAHAAGIQRTFQTPQVVDGLTCLENVMLADPDRRLVGFGAAVGRRRAMVAAETARAERARTALSRMGLDDWADAPAAALAYGQRRRLEFARVVAADAPVVLLDEPAAGLNATETAWLAGVLLALRDEGRALLVVEHKLALLNQVCDHLVVLQLGTLVTEGRPAEVWQDVRVVAAYLGAPSVGTPNTVAPNTVAPNIGTPNIGTPDADAPDADAPAAAPPEIGASQ